MRCCLVTLSREAFKPSQFSEADVLSQRLFSLKKNSEGRKAQFKRHRIYFAVRANHNGNAWENAEVFTNLYKEEQTRHQKQHFTKPGFWCWFISPKYIKFNINFYFWILKYTSDNRSLKILHISLHYYHIIAVREVSGANPISTQLLDTESK